MRTPYLCGSEERRAAVRSARAVDGATPLLNGIDHLEVASADQRVLELFFIHPLPGEVDGVPGGVALAAHQFSIEGGTRRGGVRVTSVSSNGNVLTLNVDEAGDFSTYTLRLSAAAGVADAPAGFDPALSAVDFSFKVECPSPFDCASVEACDAPAAAPPPLDYLARDYASFRRLLLDRMAVLVPDWTERNPADLGVTLVELLAYAADRLTYQQDAAAAEAYLGTARRRPSVRRHARLLDYAMHDGANARAWLVLRVDAGGDGEVLRGPRPAAGTSAPEGGALFLTRTAGLDSALGDEGAAAALRQGAQPFEAMHDLTLRAAFSEIRFHTWSEPGCCLPRGARRAWLRNEGNALAGLAPGHVLLFEEVRGAASGRAEDVDPARRHVVRLTAVRFTEDPLLPDEEGGAADSPRLRLAEIEWGEADALPFALRLFDVEDPEVPGSLVPVAVVRGNVVLADHGRSVRGPDVIVPAAGVFRPRLEGSTIAEVAQVRTRGGERAPHDAAAGAGAALETDVRSALPAIVLRQVGARARVWQPRRDLLDSDAFDAHFAAERDDDGATTLRFGDGRFGARPAAGVTLETYVRLGGGRAGNVGAESIAHIAAPIDGVLEVRNPLPARGGASPEPLERVRLDAPQAFRVQERAVTEADYAAMAQRHPSVHHAAATMRWTGSWHTVYVTVDRRGGLPVDAAFEAELQRFLQRYALAGYDIEIEPPRFVPLDVALTVCVAAGHVRSAVHAALVEQFSNGDLPGGGRGFFHPDTLTFGQPVYLSAVIARAMAVPGVASVDAEDAPGKPNRFRRWGRPAAGEFARGRIELRRLEIARVDSDPSAAENGRIEFFMKGGV